MLVCLFRELVPAHSVFALLCDCFAYFAVPCLLYRKGSEERAKKSTFIWYRAAPNYASVLVAANLAASASRDACAAARRATGTRKGEQLT